MNVLSPGNASAVTEGTQTPLGTSTTQMNVMQSLASAAPVRNNETDEDVDSNDNCAHAYKFLYIITSKYTFHNAVCLLFHSTMEIQGRNIIIKATKTQSTKKPIKKEGKIHFK